MPGVILWDFHGTLASRSWSGAMLDVLRSDDPHTSVVREDISLALQDGFPWHRPEQPHPELDDPQCWWERMIERLASAYRAVGADAERARTLASLAREHYIDPSHYEVFDDTRPALESLHENGWRHWILSNHVPELRDIVWALGWRDLFDGVLTSARLGFEKPHPEVFAIARARVKAPGAMWMVGDNIEADVLGAQRCGIPAILVRKQDVRALHRCEDLHGVGALLEER